MGTTLTSNSQWSTCLWLLSIRIESIGLRTRQFLMTIVSAYYQAQRKQNLSFIHITHTHTHSILRVINSR